MRSRNALRTLLVAAAATTLTAACEHPMFEDTVFDRAYLDRHLPNEESVLKQSSFEPRAVGVVQTYCYHTIASVDCYAHPQDEERYRLKGYFGPAPQ